MLITHRTYIACPVQRVWAATIDIDSWPDWAPTVQTARRLDKLRFGLGSQASIKQPMQSRTIWTVTEFKDGHSFAWESAGKAFRMLATHHVASSGDGTVCTLEVKLIGPFAMMCAVFFAPMVWLALMQENRGLKRWCEANSGPKLTTTHQSGDARSDAKKQLSETTTWNEG